MSELRKLRRKVAKSGLPGGTFKGGDPFQLPPRKRPWNLPKAKAGRGKKKVAK